MQLSKLENEAYEKLKNNDVLIFKVKDLCLLVGIKKVKAYNLIKALKKKGAIIKAGKRFFALKGVDERLIGLRLSYPSYISFWSALSYYGLTDQMPKTMFFATTRYTKSINNFRYVTLSKKRFFGYTSVGGLAIAEEEKAIIDSLFFPKYAGGMKELIKCIKLSSRIDTEKLVNYAIRVGSRVVVRRLGFTLENMGCKRKTIERLVKHIGKGYELLDPSSKKKGNLNRKWLLDINW